MALKSQRSPRLKNAQKDKLDFGHKTAHASLSGKQFVFVSGLSGFLGVFVVISGPSERKATEPVSFEEGG